MIDTQLTGFLGVATAISVGLMLAGLALTVIRLLRGPTLPDRVIALDLITMMLVAFLGLFTLATGVNAYLDVAISLALVGFFGTVAFARFIDRSRPGNRKLGPIANGRPQPSGDPS